MKNLLFVVGLILLCMGCTKTTKSTRGDVPNDAELVEIPNFSADSAFLYISQQVDFGPRVPNTSQHDACAQFLADKLEAFGADVTIQEADVKSFDGKVLQIKNIIGAFNPQNKTRIMLFAHWDTRPWADQDANADNFDTPILGANDGASGVGVLLEIARQLQVQAPNVGVDIFFFDAEDGGAPEKWASDATSDSWCLGSQYWAKNKHIHNYHPKYGILLDMVGAPNATFYREQISDYYGKYLVDKVWKQAAELGFSQYFVDKVGNGITDDHLYVNQIGGIPSIDIIHQEKQEVSGFAHYWHTVNDNIDNVDKGTLQALGTTLLHIIYKEK